ncbi:MAG: cytidylate kinase, partial [Actinomycetota bacterium]|nr:cytidylate kinase [Actinomycetota bacterium]
CRAEDAVELDTTDLDAATVVRRLSGLVAQRGLLVAAERDRT